MVGCGLLILFLISFLIYYIVNRNKEKSQGTSKKNPEEQASDDTTVYIVIGSVLFVIFVIAAFVAVRLKGLNDKSDSEEAQRAIATNEMDKEAEAINLEKIELNKELAELESKGLTSAALQTQTRLLESRFKKLNVRIKKYNSRSGEFGKLKEIEINKVIALMRTASIKSAKTGNTRRSSKTIKAIDKKAEKTKKEVIALMDEGKFEDAENLVSKFNNDVYSTGSGTLMYLQHYYSVKRFEKLKEKVLESIEDLGAEAKIFGNKRYDEYQELVDTYNNRVDNFEELEDEKRDELKIKE